jgi:hypothetical protein
LLGATDKITKSNFNMNFDPCDGSGSCVCCGACAITAFCGGLVATNILQSLLGYCCVRSQILSHIKNPKKSTSMGYIEYFFCTPCAICTDYRTAQNMFAVKQSEMPKNRSSATLASKKQKPGRPRND